MAPETPTRRQNEDNANTLRNGDYSPLSSPHNNTNNNNNHAPKYGSLTPQNSLCDKEGQQTNRSSSLLAPPASYSRERRLSSSSCDSSVSKAARRRMRRNSSSRLSDLVDDKKEITLLTFAKGAQFVGKKIGAGFKKAVGKLFVPRLQKQKLVHEAEVMEEVCCICKDYIINKLTLRDLMSRKVGFTQTNSKNSVHIINSGTALEMMYPRTYSNVSRKLSMTMSSVKIVRTTLSLFLEILFEGSITWGKVVSMFTVAGLFAEECASQGHADFVQEVVHVVVDYTGSSLLPWLVQQGGWDAFPLPGCSQNSRLSKLRLLIVACGATAVAVSSSSILDLW
ncbi:bcl-2-related ovarian killer protein B [Biomphalaria pfeifferi]|uniref:Bcl-2-related ovarian killer protein B n=1 Tax=Biomphalaria pfeifferi TaxID=112525 RepID=A0AAD8C676_BIOPF|nr:bcl-2-related ovarian killer protein B [Biomphalaria pfeifferi]